jgi:hypothetical protein
VNINNNIRNVIYAVLVLYKNKHQAWSYVCSLPSMWIYIFPQEVSECFVFGRQTFLLFMVVIFSGGSTGAGGGGGGFGE